MAAKDARKWADFVRKKMFLYARFHLDVLYRGLRAHARSVLLCTGRLYIYSIYSPKSFMYPGCRKKKRDKTAGGQ